MNMAVPGDYNDALYALGAGLSADTQWKMAFDAQQSDDWSGRALSAVLVVTGPKPPLWVVPWSNNQVDTLGAYVFTADTLVRLEVSAPDSMQRRSAVAHVLPLVVESLEVAASASPWGESYGRDPRWPGAITATVRLAGVERPIAIPSHPIETPEGHEALRGFVAILVDRVRTRPARGGSDDQ